MHTFGIVSLFLQYLLASYIKMYKYDFGGRLSQERKMKNLSQSKMD